MCTYLKNMEGKKPKDLKNKSFDSIQKMFDRAFKRVNTFVDFRTDLVEGSSKRAGEELEQESTKKQKVDEDKDTAELQSLMEVIPDEEEVAIDVVPLATKPPTIVDWKIHKEGKKSYYQIVRADGNDLKTMFEPYVEDEIWKLQQRKELSLYTPTITVIILPRIKSLLNAVSIIAALIDVNAAQSKLVLLENFNENYSKCLRLLVKVTTASTKLLTTRGSSMLVVVKAPQDFISELGGKSLCLLILELSRYLELDVAKQVFEMGMSPSQICIDLLAS
ncbi:hypothetical protein Tco_0461048 [Tanacetum coccineum]